MASTSQLPPFSTPPLPQRRAVAAAPRPPARPTDPGRQALLAHDYGAAEAAFAALQQSEDAAVRRDGELGLAILTLSSLAPPAAAPQPTPEGTPVPPPFVGPEGATVPKGAAADGPSARFDRAIELLSNQPKGVARSEMAQLGAAHAALFLGRPDDAWRALAAAPNSDEVVLARAAAQQGLGAPKQARELVRQAMALRPGEPRLNAGAFAANLSAAQASLYLAYAAADAAAADKDPRYEARDLLLMVQRHAPTSYQAAKAQVVQAEGDARKAAWQALSDRWPRSVEAALLGVRFGFVDAATRKAWQQERPRDELLQRATLAGAIGAEDWATAVEAAEAVYLARPTAEGAGMSVKLGALAGKDEAWIAERVQRAVKLSDAQVQAVMRDAQRKVTRGEVDDALVEKLRTLATSGQPEAYIYLAQALKVQERHDDALLALDSFLQPGQASSAMFGTALLMRAKHRLYEQGRVVLDHDQACAEVGLAHADLQRIGSKDAAYDDAVRLQSMLADRRVQVSAGVRYRLNEQQVRHELAGKNFDRVRANLDYHSQSLDNQESDVYWLLRALTYEAMGKGNFAKARHAAEIAVDIALMRCRKNAAAEELLRRMYQHNEGPLHRVLSYINGIVNWLAGLLGAKA